VLVWLRENGFSTEQQIDPMLTRSDDTTTIVRCSKTGFVTFYDDAIAFGFSLAQNAMIERNGVPDTGEFAISESCRQGNVLVTQWLCEVSSRRLGSDANAELLEVFKDFSVFQDHNHPMVCLTGNTELFDLFFIAFETTPNWPHNAWAQSDGPRIYAFLDLAFYELLFAGKVTCDHMWVNDGEGASRTRPLQITYPKFGDGNVVSLSDDGEVVPASTPAVWSNADGKAGPPSCQASFNIPGGAYTRTT
jgi:hypothetical protein